MLNCNSTRCFESLITRIVAELRTPSGSTAQVEQPRVLFREQNPQVSKPRNTSAEPLLFSIRVARVRVKNTNRRCTRARNNDGNDSLDCVLARLRPKFPPRLLLRVFLLLLYARLLGSLCTGACSSIIHSFLSFFHSFYSIFRR